MTASKLQSIVEDYLEEEGLTHCFFVEERINGRKIELFLDSDEGISFDICKKISRKVEAVLDESGIYGEDYILEVSSPGIGNPLKLPRQYMKNIGRQIEVKSADQKFKGQLMTADDAGIRIEFEEIVKEGKKKKKVVHTKQFSYPDISEARIKIKF